jgi:putative endonuclease
MGEDWQPAVYILASRRIGTLYIGVTSNLRRRVFEHREGLIAGFARDYGVRLLVHYELALEMRAAIVREKQLKKWERAWKIRLIEEGNPTWRDLAEDLGFPALVPGSPPARG